MSARNTAIHLVTKAGTLLGALFLVGVLLAAIPAHKSQSPQTSGAQESQSTQTNANTMPSMEMNDEHTVEAEAKHEMASGSHDAHRSAHVVDRESSRDADDMQRANEVGSNRAGESKNN